MPLANSNINSGQQYVVISTFTSTGLRATQTGYIQLNQTDTTGVQQTNVPPNQVWKIVDSFVTATQTPDALVDIWVDNTAQNINWDANSTSLALGTTRQNPFSYMVNGGLIIGATSSIQVKIAALATVGTTAATVTLTLVIVQYPIQSK